MSWTIGAACFRGYTYGMGAGYSGIGELPPDIGVLSVHGPGPLLLYAWFAKVFGWGYSAIILCNALWGISRSDRLCRSGKAQGKHSSAIIALTCCFTRRISSMPAPSMTEIANYGMLLLYAGGLYRLHKKVSLPMLLLALATVTLMSVYRISYFLLYLPVVIVACGRKINRRLVLSVVAVVVVSFFINFFARKITSPYESGFLYHFLRADFIEALRMFWFHLLKNLHGYFVPGAGAFGRGCTAVAVQRCSAFMRSTADCKKEGPLALRYVPGAFGIAVAGDFMFL